MRAVILAGGKGTRLRPFTASFPKALVPLGDKPVIEVLIEHLASHGIRDVTLTLGHLASLVRAYFEQHELLRHGQHLLVAEPSGEDGQQRDVVAGRHALGVAGAQPAHDRVEESGQGHSSDSMGRRISGRSACRR